MITRIIFTVIIGVNLSFSQNFSDTLKEIKSENQLCLDNGDKMFSCSFEYLKKSDNLLNLVYNSLRKALTENEKIVLKAEQIKWISKKEKEFENIDNLNSGLGNGLDDKMFKNQQKAEFIIPRIEYLINYKESKSSQNLEDFIPLNYKLFSKHFGDLNKDGLKDCVLIIKGTQKSKFVRDEHKGIVDRNNRGIIVLLNQGNDFFKLLIENHNCFSSENEDGGIYFPPELSILTEKNKLFFYYSHGRYGYWKYQFRIKKNDLELIEFDSSYGGAVIRSQTSINFLTKKKLYQKNINENDKGGEEIFKDTWTNITLQKTILLSEIKSFNELDMDKY